MKFNQIFCNHIWETNYVRLIGQAIRYVVDTPIAEKRTYVIQSTCTKCGKTLQEQQEKERYLSADEVQQLIEHDKLRFRPWED